MGWGWLSFRASKHICSELFLYDAYCSYLYCVHITFPWSCQHGHQCMFLVQNYQASALLQHRQHHLLSGIFPSVDSFGHLFCNCILCFVAALVVVSSLFPFCFIYETNLCHYDNMVWFGLVMFEPTSLWSICKNLIKIWLVLAVLEKI